MASQAGENYKFIKSVFKEIEAHPETGTEIKLTENEDTLTLRLAVTDGDDELAFVYIWGNNPVTLLWKEEVKVFSSINENMLPKVVDIIHNWKRSKKV